MSGLPRASFSYNCYKFDGKMRQSVWKYCYLFYFPYADRYQLENTSVSCTLQTQLYFFQELSQEGESEYLGFMI